MLLIAYTQALAPGAYFSVARKGSAASYYLPLDGLYYLQRAYYATLDAAWCCGVATLYDIRQAALQATIRLRFSGRLDCLVASIRQNTLP